MQIPAARRTWLRRSTELRRQILAASGLLVMPERGRVPAITVGRREFSDFAVENVLLETWPGYFLAGNLWVPVLRGRRPAVLLPHGHWDGGRLENSEVCSTPALGAGLARRGYLAFSYDMVGYTDSRQTPHEFGESEPSRLWSWGPLALQLWNSLRVFDWLRSRPDADEARIGVTGASGGGTQTFLLTAVERRIRAAAPVNMVSYTMQGGCVCENASGLRVGANNVEIAALAAPRPMLLVSTTRDWTKNTMREEWPDLRKIYRLFGREENVEAVQFDAPHNYNRDSREAVYRFFERHLKGVRNAPVQTEAPLPFDSVDFLRIPRSSRPAGAVAMEELVNSWRAQARAAVRTARPQEIRANLQATCGCEWPPLVESAKSENGLILSRPGKGDLVRCRLSGAGDEAVLLVNGAAHPPPTGKTVLELEPFRTRNESRPHGDRHFYTFHRADDALRVQDILTGLRYLQQNGARTVTLAASKKALAWSAAAASVAPMRVEIDVSSLPDEPDDKWYVEHLMIPGIRRVGGISAIRRLLARR